MFWKKSDEAVKEKLPKPKEMPRQVKEYLIKEEKKDARLFEELKAALRKDPKAEHAFHVRLFDESEAIVNNVTVVDYTSLDEHPELIYYEGWFDSKSWEVELKQKKELKPKPDVPALSEDEILKKIEGLSQPGNTAFFYLGGSPAYGGPFGRGAAVIELNPKYPGEKEKKYIVHVANVQGLEPVGNRQKMFDTDKAKEAAKWVKERHYKPGQFS